MGDILKGNPPGHVTGETGTSSLSGSGNNPTDLASGAGKHRAVGLNPRLLRRLTVSRQFTAKIPDARRAFKQLEIKGKNSEPGNQFFQEYGTGNTIDMIDRPYERFFAYESLLEDLKDDDKEKYKKIHKGTPYYFLAWTAFLIGDYEKAVFYMDAAISEDIENLPGDWTDYPAGHFLTLDDTGHQVAKIITQELKAEIDTQINRFNKITQKELTTEKFVNQFVKALYKDAETRSIITTFYCFILGYPDRLRMISLRSEYRGSIEPFLVHLFKGGLLVESLLKKLNGEIQDAVTLGSCFTNDICVIYRIKKDETFFKKPETFKEIIEYGRTGTSSTEAFRTAYLVRNFTGHNLARVDYFYDPDDYASLCNQIFNALFFIVSKHLGL